MRFIYIVVLCSLALLVLLPALTAGLPYAEDKSYDYDAENSDVSGEDTAAENTASKGSERVVPDTPNFITSSESLIVNEGDTLRLPCLVDRLEGFVMLWKKHKNIITVGSQIIDQRVRLEEEVNGNHLVIGQATPEDSGEYTCQISAFTPTEITHKVIIRVQPVIRTTPEERLVVTAGSQATIECIIEAGTPTPELKWIKKKGKVITGEEDVVGDGSTLTISEVTKKDAGQYLCLADNGFGPSPVQKEISFEVHYAPEIEIEESYIVTDMDEEQEIVCIVDSSPPAEVTWKLNSMTINAESVNIVLSQNEDRHSLLIVSVSNESVGEYSCTATNSIGEATAKIEISGEAHPVVILSPHISNDQNMFTLEWSAESESEIELFQVAVRKEGEAEWKLHEVSMNENGTNHTNATDRDTEYRAELTLTELEPATKYEVTVASKNKFGLSSHGDLFIFVTKEADPEPDKQEPHKSLDVNTDPTTIEEQNTEVESPVTKIPDKIPAVLTSSSKDIKPLVITFFLSCIALRL